MSKKSLISVNNVRKYFKDRQRQELLVLESMNFEMQPGEIVAVLGKSGSGKSTFLRIIAGLIEASSGEVTYRGKPVLGPVQGISMVFQSFALLPWLTVLQNVELGLEALGVDKEERRTRALKVIDTIGLDGFESAFPKELSGGMRQRVGFARALVVNPDVLLMDEPFSALDVLTAENLKADLMDLWQEKKTSLSGILIVTHSIEEAVQLADRIIIFGSNPGCIFDELRVSLPHPRNDQDMRFRAVVDEVYTLMTTQKPEEQVPSDEQVPIDLGHRLPDAHVSELTGLMETLIAPENTGGMDLPDLAESLMLDIDDLFPLMELLEILHFAEISDGDITLTEAGRTFGEADILQRKQIFSVHLQRYVPLAKHIRELLERRPRHRALEEKFLSLLEDFLSEKEAARVLKVVIDWGRYAELFAYDYNTGVLSLENPD